MNTSVLASIYTCQLFLFGEFPEMQLLGQMLQQTHIAPLLSRKAIRIYTPRCQGTGAAKAHPSETWTCSGF